MTQKKELMKKSVSATPSTLLANFKSQNGEAKNQIAVYAW